MAHISRLCSAFLKSLVISKQVESGKDSKFTRDETTQSMEVDKDDDSDEAKDDEQTAGPTLSKSQKKKKKNKKQGKQLIKNIKNISDSDILGFGFDNTGDWTAKENKRTSVKSRKGQNCTETEPEEAVSNIDAKLDDGTSTNTATDDNKKNKKRAKRRRKSSSSNKNSFSIDDLSELNIDALFNER